ncbi:unnamed protein product [Mytilus coruscus]|uniref:Death domain-containing protein n=1 Tax=Mytilus coruscus TaxID=42192 RepID=A0A6J8DV32_MYTCO|nr:unnamed protein product [Mytilus coruscus]
MPNFTLLDNQQKIIYLLSCEDNQIFYFPVQNLLTESKVLLQFTMPLTKVHAFKIKKNFTSIIANLKIDDIVDHMINEDVFDYDDMEKINSKVTQKDKNREFVTILIKSKPKGYEEFIKCLRESGVYGDIADQIEQTVVEVVENETLESWIGNRMPSGMENQYLKDIDLLCFSKAITPAHLQIVGTCLGFSKVDVEHIEYKHLRAPEAACHDLLVKWRNKHGHSATVAKLMDIFFLAHQNTPESIHDEKIWDALEKFK